MQNLIFVMGFHTKVDNVCWALIANFGDLGWVTTKSLYMGVGYHAEFDCARWGFMQNLITQGGLSHKI